MSVNTMGVTVNSVSRDNHPRHWLRPQHKADDLLNKITEKPLIN